MVILFNRPNVKNIEEEFIIYRLRFDGINVNEHGIINTYYQMNSDIVNCIRKNMMMSCFGMLVSKDNLDYISDYLQRFMILGINGIWIKKNKKWYHYRWFINCVSCDTVAQEQLIGEINKKLTGSPFLFGPDLKVRFNPDFHGYQLFYDYILPLLNQGKFVLPCRPINFLNPNSLFRCLSLICHSDSDQIIEVIEREYKFFLSEQQKKEIMQLKKLFNLFDNMHQYLPNVIVEEDIPVFKNECIYNATSGIMEEKCVKTFLENGEKKKDNEVPHNNLLEGNVLVPIEQILCLDGMHNISNICQSFITILNDKIDYPDLKTINTKLCNLLNRDKSNWTICPSFKNVYKLAKVRHDELQKLKFVKKDLLNTNVFKKASTHEDVLYLCSFYGYLFQDSMDIPFIFFFKIVFDYLIYFFNVNYNISKLVEKQRIFNFILGILQNEVLPYYLKISIYNAMYYVNSIYNCGDIASTNCFSTESSYKYTRKDFYPNIKPDEICALRLIMLGIVHECNFDECNKR